MVDKEIKRQNFIRLAEDRVTATMQKIRLVGNLSDKRHYEYTDAEATKIINTLNDELKSVKEKFKGSINRNRRFKL
ncbi:hypothetical protein M1N55_06515 [Dehalococcoidia bacterium]|nr:hypothetical protein [Dehalococcoidia bacterium]